MELYKEVLFMAENKAPETMENEKLELVKEELVEAGKKAGTLQYDDVADKLSVFELEPDEIDAFYEHLEEQGIEIIAVDGQRTKHSEDLVSADEHRDLSLPLGVKINDPVRMYLKEIGCFELLTAVEELSLANRL